jgi:hypothetical protein
MNGGIQPTKIVGDKDDQVGLGIGGKSASFPKQADERKHASHNRFHFRFFQIMLR